VDWSTDGWWHPVPVEEITWAEFRDAVQPTPQDVQASGYLGWQEGWEPFAEFLAREPGGGTQAWFKGRLPSGRPVYVWVGSGVEHWWTPGGEGIDVYGEHALIAQAQEALDELAEQRQVTLADTLSAIQAAVRAAR
jgi:hypothetical protein